MFIFAEWSHQLHSMGLVHIIGIISAILFGIIVSASASAPGISSTIVSKCLISVSIISTILFICTSRCISSNYIFIRF